MILESDRVSFYKMNWVSSGLSRLYKKKNSQKKSETKDSLVITELLFVLFL